MFCELFGGNVKEASTRGSLPEFLRVGDVNLNPIQVSVNCEVYGAFDMELSSKFLANKELSWCVETGSNL